MTKNINIKTKTRTEFVDITSDVQNAIDESEMKKRQAEWKRPKAKFQRGWLARYERLVTSAAHGAVLEPPEW